MGEQIEGRNAVFEALNAGRSISKIMIAKGAAHGSVEKILHKARASGIAVQEVDRKQLDAMAESNSHQGVIAIAAQKDYVDLSDILQQAAKRQEEPFLLLLDKITDPTNLGSILRTADAAGVHGIVIPKRRAVGLTATVGKASAGAVEYVPVAQVVNMARAVEELKEQGIWVVGADMEGESIYYDADLTGPIALVIGSEGEGIGRLVKEKCDFLVRLPMKGNISSLNAGVAAALLMYEVMRQREEKGRGVEQQTGDKR